MRGGKRQDGGMRIKEWKMEVGREDKEEGEREKGKAAISDRINVFTGAVLCRGVVGEGGGWTGKMGIQD